MRSCSDSVIESCQELSAMTLELARLGTSELGWCVIALLIGFRSSRFDIHCCKLIVVKTIVHLLSERCALTPTGDAPLPL